MEASKFSPLMGLRLSVRGMRRCMVWFASFAVLGVGMLVAWSWRYERDPGAITWTLDDLQLVESPVGGMGTPTDELARGVVLSKSPEGPLPMCSWMPPEDPSFEHVHLAYRLRADDMVMGSQAWSRGRLSIEWIQEGKSQMIPIIEVDAHGPQIIASQVLESPQGPSRARLWLHHYGSGGRLWLDDLQVTAVRERAWWSWCAMALTLGWGVWWMALLRRCLGVRWFQGLAAIGVLGVVLCFLVLPPSNDIKPQRWGMVHHLGKPPAPVMATVGSEALNPPPVDIQAPPVDIQIPSVAPSVQPAPKPSAEAPAVAPTLTRQWAEVAMDMRRAGHAYGVAKSSGSLQQSMARWMLRLKPVLHVMCWWLPTVLLALCLGPRAAMVLAAMLAIGSEVSQWLFGYQSDWHDGMDLVLNLIGVGLAGLLVVMVRRRVGTRGSKST